ncbi:MAG: hypothetical protein PWR10_653 [Halanaerobiales bacterium]|nr:hypothetical protein [Halanaerobiales bacterium]
MVSLYEKNISCLDEKDRKLLADFNTFRDLKLVKTKNEEFTVKVNVKDREDIFLHSLYNPQREAIRFADSQDLTGKKSIVLIGFGLGYHVEEILSRLKREQALNIIVPNLDIFKLALENRDLTGVLRDERVKIVLAAEPASFTREIQLLLDNLSSSVSQLIVHSQSIKIIPDGFLFFKDILEEIRVSSYNSERLGRAIKNNLIKNISLVNKTIGVKSFTGLFSEVPVFIISAGPSLDKNINVLEEIKDRGVIISVDTALTPLLKREIRPDFVVTIEPIKIVYDRVFSKYKDLDIPLLHTLGTNWKVVENYKGPKIIGLAKDDLIMDRLAEKVDKGRILTGGTVALTALDFALQLGGNPIIFVGQDFAYSKEGITHASDTFYGNARKDISQLREIEGIVEDKVYTSTSYYLYLRKFERFIAENKGITFIDATEGGAKIKGTRIMTLKKVISTYCKFSFGRKEIITSVIREYKSQNNNLPVEKLRNFLKMELS